MIIEKATKSDNYNFCLLIGWAIWSFWTPCSQSCGRGIQSKTRLCAVGPCPGKGTLTRECDGNHRDCPSCKKTIHLTNCNLSI